ncbi:site-specific integrase [Aestuariibaculum lutulentum]|uniref:Site-specific integrase n=1 Tax=Aestuariibaculum lutulentum TaxID=2920935 RepID=A0ABS9RMH0_9FLAO|nr:site-specific integrase [Aestuariibaculum lutulentum]MCH4554139.1 site-specific integrase [Aestuariibaculum lutulentum]
MKTTQTFSVLFWLKQSSIKNGKAPLYARITVNGKRAELSLKRKVLISEWDSNKSRLKGLGDEAKLINEFLRQVNVDLFEIYQNLKREGKLISSSIIKSQYLGENDSRQALTDIIDYHKIHMKSTLRWGTQKNYFTTHKYIFKFLKLKYATTDMYLSELNYQFIIDFERFLKVQENMSNNTVMKHIERLRKLVSLAFKMEWIDKDPFIKFEAKYDKKERCFLTAEELEAIENKSFDITRLQQIKDLFVFACYTGLSYGDVMQLTPNDLCLGIDGKLWIHSKREKTNVPIKIPLLQKALELIEKYETYPESVSNQTIFPGISNQKLNSYLKEIADVCRIKKNLTFHVARHTFATTVTLSNGVPIETVSKLLGHTKLSTTQIYARVVESKISEDMGSLHQKLEKRTAEI